MLDSGDVEVILNYMAPEFLYFLCVFFVVFSFICVAAIVSYWEE